MKSASQLKRYGSTSSSLGKYSREPSPAALEHTNRLRSRDPSPVTRPYRAQSRDPSPALESKYKLGYGSSSSYRMNVPKTAPPSSSYGSRYGTTRTPSSTSIGEKSSSAYGSASTTRTPSSTSLADKSTAYTKRTPSSTSLADKPTTYGSSSAKRTPSSASLAERSMSYDNAKATEKSMAYGSSSTTRTPSSAFVTEKPVSYGNSDGEKYMSYDSSRTLQTPTSTSSSVAVKPTTYGSSNATQTHSSTSVPDKSTTYRSASTTRSPSSASISDKSLSISSDYRSRPVGKAKNTSPPKTNEKQSESNKKPEEPAPIPMQEETKKQIEADEDSETTEESDTSEDEELEVPAELFLTITVCTRGTSPNPPGSPPSQHSQSPRTDIAMTIEKTILRSTQKRKMLEKEMQSDETSKYSRYAVTSRLSPYSPRSDRGSPSNLRYSSSPLSTTSKSASLSTNESKREDSTTSSSSSSKAATKSSTSSKSKLSPPRVGRLKSRQSSVESLSPHKPPVGPKAESPLKLSSPSSTSLQLTKLPNKDFRKSSLNVGSAADRARKSRTPSTGNDSDFNTIEALNGALQAIQRLERSPSAGSEISNASNRSIRSRNLNESKLRQRCLNKPLGSRTPPSPLSRQNSATSIRQKSPLIASPLATRSNKILVTLPTSSSSGTESSAEVKKPHKKIIKKKVVKDIPSPATTNSSTTTTLSSSTNNSDNQSASGTSSRIKRSLPQPSIAVTSPTTAGNVVPTTITVGGSKTKKSESSALKKSSSASSRPEKDPLRRLKKLSSVSNFFVTQQKNTNSDEQIYLESSETSGGASGAGSGSGSGSGTTSTDFDVGSTKSSSKKSISLIRANETKTTKISTPAKSNGSTSASSQRNSPVQYTRESSASEHPIRITKSLSSSAKSTPTTSVSKSKSKSKSRSTSVTSSSHCAQKSSIPSVSSRMPTEQQSESLSPYTATTTGTTSTGGTDSEEASWWQDTSQQIDTSSALDFSFKDEMRFKVRHADSGEAAWWLRNDEDATLADDLTTLNQDEEDDVGTDIFDENGNGTKDATTGWWETDENDPNPNDYQNERDYPKDISISDLDYKTKPGYYTEQQETTDGESSRPFPRSRLTPETDWWNDDEEENKQVEQPEPPPAASAPKQNGTIQLKICRVESGETPWWQQEDTSKEVSKSSENIENQQTTESSEPSSSSTTDQKKWWLSGPAKKLFKIPRVESGEKAWWQSNNSDKDSQRSKSQQPERMVDAPNSETEQAPPKNATIKKLFNLPRVESGEKAWWLADNSDKEEKRSISQDPERLVDSKQNQVIAEKEDRLTSPTKKIFNLSRVDSEQEEEKPWWQQETSDRGQTRSRSHDSDHCPQIKQVGTPPAEVGKQHLWFPDRRSSSESPIKKVFSPQQSLEETERFAADKSHAVKEQRQINPTKKLFKFSRVDSEQEEEAWWQQDIPERSKTRSRSRDVEQRLEGKPRTRAEKWQQEATPPCESGEQEIWLQQDRRSNESPAKRVLTHQQSLEEQKERWLQDRNRQYQEPTEQPPRSRSTPQRWAADQTAAHRMPENYQPLNQSFQSNTDDDEGVQQFDDDQHATFMPSNRADSQTELSNSFNFEYSERPPPLGQCASPVQQEEEQPARHEPYCSSPYDNIPMTKVQQTSATTMAAATANAAVLDTPNLMPILGATTPASPTLGHLTAYNENANNTSAYQQEHLKQQQTPPSSPQKQWSPPQQYNNNDLRSKTGKQFISRHQNIDELLSGSCRPLSPLYFDNDGSFQTMPTQRNLFLEEITPDQVRIHDSTAQTPFIQRMDSREDWEQTAAANARSPPRSEQRVIDDAAIQVYKDGDYGAYLDLESSLAEQAEEIEGLNSSRKNSLVVRTQLSVRVHAIIEKLLSAEGSDLRRALFSLKQVFQEDKDLVHAFVALGGLNCLVRVGNGADQNYQNYILRALGQVMLYVDGMNGVMKHEPTMQWLYSLIASNYRSVVKTALKLLLVFVEYAESNCHLLVSAIHTVDKQQGTLPWSNIMRLLKDYDNADAELVIYAASLINKTLGGLNDQDSFYDESDLLEQQGMESVIQHYMSKPGTDMDLINQLQLYEAVLKFEDGESDGTRLPDNTLRKTQRFRNSTDTAERRKSRRHSTGTSPGNINKVLPTHARLTPTQPALDEDSSSSTNSAEYTSGVFVDKNNRDGAGVTPGLRRRRERAERHRSFLKEQQEAAAAVAAAAANGYLNGLEKREELAASAIGSATLAAKKLFDEPPTPQTPSTPAHANESPLTAYTTSASSTSSPSTATSTSTPQTTPGEYPPTPPPTSVAYNTISNTSVVPPPPPPPPPPPDLLFGLSRPLNFYNSNNNQTATSSSTTTTTNFSNNNNNINNNSNNITTDAVDYLKISESDSEDKKRMLQLKRDHTVKDLTQKLSNLPTTSPTHEDKLQNRIVGDMSGLISKAKEGLAKSKSKGEVSRASSVDQEIKKVEPKKSENELQWEELVRNMVRPLQLCDLDFTDLNSEDEKDIMAPRGPGRGVPPPPPPMGGVALPPPMLPAHIVLPPPMMSQSNTSNGSGIVPPPMLSHSGYANSSLTNSLNSSLNGSINGDTIRKNKKTVKLFWKEVREDLIPVAVGKTIWDELPTTTVDTQKLEHLFESRAKDLMTKEKQQEMNKSKEVIVLDHKRSNAINIAMTKLPPPRAIKAAILKMDATVVTREGIDKLLNMLPTDEEKGKIQEAQMANPELPLGSAEQFLLTLASISELPARLRLWAFRLDFDNSEKEIAEPLMDLKHGIEILRNNRTFKCILSTLLSVGIFLNGAPVKGFQIEYLAKVPEVKDTVHKHSLLHHLCHIVMESGTETSDLYSEIGPITRASKADFNDLAYNLSQLEHECKSSWDRLKLMCKHDCPPQLQQKLVDFLADCAERIIILQIVHRRIMNRYRKFLLWLGVPQHSVADSRPNEFCRILSEFALEYRTTRERVQQQIEKKANHRERNKTRGKLIVDIAKFKTKEDKQDAELKELLGTPSLDSADGTLTWRRRRAENLRSPQMRQSEENFTDGDDEILESLVKTATKAPGNRTTPRERKRTRHADRKSCFCFENVHDEHEHY